VSWSLRFAEPIVLAHGRKLNGHADRVSIQERKSPPWARRKLKRDTA
jgi:hypothetical protein